MPEAALDFVEVVGTCSIVVAAGVLMVAATPGFDVVVCLVVVPPPTVLVATGSPLPPVVVAPADASPSTLPMSVQKFSKSVTMERLSGAAEETNSAHVNTKPSKMSGTHAVLVGLTLE